MAAPTALGDGWPVFTGATVEPSAHIGSGGRGQTALEKRRGGTARTEPDAEDGPDSAAVTRREEYRRGLELHMAEVRRFVALRVSSYADAEDIAQEVLLQAWVKLGTFRGGNFLAWLYAIARRLVADHYRAQRRFQSLEAAPVELAESEPALRTAAETVQVVCDCRARLGSWVECVTRRLPLEEQVAVLLADVHGYRDKESAAALGISLASFKLLLHQARARLRAIGAGACALLQQAGKAAAAAGTPGNEDAGGARNTARCRNPHQCPVSNCRLGLKCGRQAPRLVTLRDELLAGLVLPGWGA